MFYWANKYMESEDLGPYEDSSILGRIGIRKREKDASFDFFTLFVVFHQRTNTVVAIGWLGGVVGI